LSGNGYFQDIAKFTDSHLAILFISDSLVESLAEADCDEKDRNAIVARIARITMTTMSSTNVNALFEFFIKIKLC
jgi:purine-nucleoside phosphorylase